MIKFMNPAYQNIYAVVKRIPTGQVATYGQIARLAGLAGHARMVGYALHSLPRGLDVPWHRVINGKGEVSELPDPDSRMMQRYLLEEEGIVFDDKGRVSLRKYRWRED